MDLDEIKALPVARSSQPTPRTSISGCRTRCCRDGLEVMEAWGFEYKSNLVWHKVRKDGGSDGRGVGFYFRNVTEIVLFGVRGKNARTLAPGRRQVNLLATRKREHSRKPDEQYAIIEACSPGRISSFSPAAPGRDGRRGASRRMILTRRRGRRIGIIRRESSRYPSSLLKKGAIPLRVEDSGSAEPPVPGTNLMTVKSSSLRVTGAKISANSSCVTTRGSVAIAKYAGLKNRMRPL